MRGVWNERNTRARHDALEMIESRGNDGRSVESDIGEVGRTTSWAVVVKHHDRSTRPGKQVKHRFLAAFRRDAQKEALRAVSERLSNRLCVKFGGRANDLHIPDMPCVEKAEDSGEVFAAGLAFELWRQ